MAELQRAATTVQDQALTIRALERTIERLQEQANERDRLRYAANVAELNADKRIAQHGHALAATRREVDSMAERIRQEHDRLRDQNATLRDALTRSDLKNKSLLKQLQRTKRSGQGISAELSMATQTYRVFYTLAQRYRESRKSIEPTAYDLSLYRHASEFKARRYTNSTEIDTRTLYYFSKLTMSAVKNAERKRFHDLTVTNAILLHNEIFQLVPHPKTLPEPGFADQLPAQGLPGVKL